MELWREGQDSTVGPTQPARRVLHEDRDARWRQMERRLKPGADVPAVDGQFLHAQGEKLPYRAAVGLTRIVAELLPIPTAELSQQGREFYVSGAKGGQKCLSQPLPTRDGALRNER
jgi:hypothetical protein